MHHQTKYIGRGNSIEKYAIANIHSMGNPSSNVHKECPDSIFFYFCWGVTGRFDDTKSKKPTKTAPKDSVPSNGGRCSLGPN